MFKIAEGKGLDLLLINARITPPVVKLLDFETFLREKSKSQYESSKRGHSRNVSRLKAIVLKLKISENDLV
ncbi:hypothetical protein PVNG_02487 [Plasmodium vivax North Korean]|uniref:Translation initiation factor 3 N-terminal domain-containing protein n=1 Tax=Plasmodium vivax North Korean TaxID=1035514 RepID=A0A0J9W6W3_PLAVI|nr:hypothetical protein PVNG_02487 [Plasmodium vivax North Korean]